MSDEKRIYKKRRRAELEEQTHLKITESAMSLHGTVGPARTTISAIAELAGVRRSTVYRHFPDEDAIMEACSSHWMRLNPLPDPALWAAIESMEHRRKTAFLDLYTYYRGGEEMLYNVLRDEPEVAALQAVMSGLHGYLDQVKEMLTGENPQGGGLTAAAIGHALDFFTWRSLALDQGLADAECAELMCALAEVADRSAGR